MAQMDCLFAIALMVMLAGCYSDQPVGRISVAYSAIFIAVPTADLASEHPGGLRAFGANPPYALDRFGKDDD